MVDRVGLLGQEKTKMLTSLLLNSTLDQAVVLATSEEVPPLIIAARREVPEPCRRTKSRRRYNFYSSVPSASAPVRFDEGQLSERAAATTSQIAPVTSSE